MPVPLIKLSIFPPSFCTEELIIHRQNFPDIKTGDILNIYHPEAQYTQPWLLLQVGPTSVFPENNLGKQVNPDTIYVEKSIAESFHLQNFKDVHVSKVDPESVALDSVELTFRDQYMGRSDMWRLKKTLMNTVVFVNKKIEFCKGSIRCQVNEMWGQGQRVSCGLVTSETKVVFRSPTAMVYLFIQMSSEMWDFNVHGDLYYEKAVGGFLTEMFDRWKANGSQHEVTIVLFSRCFYDAKEKSQFPTHMHECLQTGYHGGFYEDFYRVVVQNERFEDWNPTLVQLRKIFTHYKQYILNYHRQLDSDGHPTIHVPTPTISTAEQGNFLEVLNMSLNTFETHYVNRNLDRTGQQSIVITPGVGTFEVDRELTLITKQRIIDSGVGSDLICVGEQPLHAVPLFKFHNRGANKYAPNDYSMPHWINLSFYNDNKKLGYSNFKPRIKLPPGIEIPPEHQNTFRSGHIDRTSTRQLSDSPKYYDEYDDQIFRMPHPRSSPSKKKKVSTDSFSRSMSQRKLSDPELRVQLSSSVQPTSSVEIPKPKFTIAPPLDRPDRLDIYSTSLGSVPLPPIALNSSAAALDLAYPTGRQEGDWSALDTMGSLESPFDHQFRKRYLLRPGRALINPFDPSHTTIRVTSNRRRWTHIFPKGPTGNYQQVHHTQGPASEEADETTPPPSENGEPFSLKYLERISNTSIGSWVGPTPNFSRPKSHHRHSSAASGTPDMKKADQTLIWGATGEQEWSPGLTTGVDWKSLTIPASLPITTDYFPDKRSLNNDYNFNEYDLSPDEVNGELTSARSPMQKRNLTTEEVFQELVSQRLAQGFQIIIKPSGDDEEPFIAGLQTSSIGKSTSMTGSKHFSGGLLNKLPPQEPAEEFWLSIGRIFHKVTLDTTKTKIMVTRFSPCHPYDKLSYGYRYRFQAPDNDNYEVSWVEFKTEKLENYNWNHLDFYVCTRGDREFPLTDALKYWRFRLYVLPLHPYVPYTKKIVEGAQYCDIYKTQTSHSEDFDLIDGFLRFTELCLNRLRRPPNSKKQASWSGGSSAAPKLRPRAVSGAAALQRVRADSGGNTPAGRASPASSSVDTGASMNSSTSESDVSATLTVATNLLEVVQAMKHPETGLQFIQSAALPSYTFVSSDAIYWLIDNMEGVNGIETAVEVMNDMLVGDFVRQAAGIEYKKNPTKFVKGFFLYYLRSSDGGEHPYNGDTDSFNRDWIQVEVKNLLTRRPSVDSATEKDDVPEFLQDDIESYVEKTQPWSKSVNYDIDTGSKSDREEWGHFRYHAEYNPELAYECSLQWTVSTGSLIAEVIYGWARKSQQHGLSIIPVPGDPFALPVTQNSDPVRGPIFVELNLACLAEEKSDLFSTFDEPSREQRLFLFRESIAKRFGFVRCPPDRSTKSSAMFSTDHQYVHCTGNMFLLIPTQLQLQTGIQGIKIKPSNQDLAGTRARNSSSAKLDEADGTSSPGGGEHEGEHITRYLSETRPAYDHSETGFLWSWNFMISKRWKQISNTGATGDIGFMDKILADFRSFCRNDGNRLERFWNDCWERRRTAEQEKN